MSPASHGCATNVLNEIKRCMSSQHTHSTQNINYNNSNEDDNDNYNVNESRGKKHSNSISKSVSNKNLNTGNTNGGLRTYAINNSTSHVQGTFASARAYSNNVLQLAAQSLPSGMPLLEVRYVTPCTFLYTALHYIALHCTFSFTTLDYVIPTSRRRRSFILKLNIKG